MKSLDRASPITRRHFLHVAGGVAAAASVPFPSLLFARNQELTISQVIFQPAKGRRLSPVAPNAYAPYRGYEVSETLLRIRTHQGLEGICHLTYRGGPEALRKLIGLDPFKLFELDANERIVGPAQAYQGLLADLGGADIALVDLLGKALKRPAAQLLGSTVRPSVQAYDGSVYMEDLLKPQEQQGLVYMHGANPATPIERVVRKAQWVVNERPEGFKALKIKIGRTKWMGSAQEALARDIEVTNAIRAAIGPDIKILVDGNLGYWGYPQLVRDYAQGVLQSKIYFMEEMFPEADLVNMRELKRGLRDNGNPVKLAAGESYPGGIAEDVYTQRFQRGHIDEPLIDIEQANMNSHGFLYLRTKAAKQAKLGMTMAPHNFGSKLGFYAQVHLGMVTPNWDISEVDDSEFPAFVPEGIEVKKGFATLTGPPGLGVRLREERLEKPSFVI